ncbi:MAG: aldehyde ferredoxin oxidoreductase family protein [Candidatus Thorarchaeota archaeon]|nr:MAG: aldehyde ferredoxin oxidoreductase family protein [Candidatus Thorarchaeota archaeon]
MNGYMGEILSVNLSNGTRDILELNKEWATQFIGGSGYAARLLYDVLPQDADPLGPENVLLWMTGPLTGTIAPCTGRHVVCGRSPLTGLWGEANAGGHFGVHLKRTGYDGLLVRGKAAGPVYIFVQKGECRIESADQLWGKTTSLTQRTLREDLGRVQVSCIGQAGENLVRFAGIINDERAAARCGLGAVMGSKNLKAVVVEGEEKVALADEEGFTDLATSTSKQLGELMRPLQEAGTATYVDIGLMYYDMPIKYFQEIEFEAGSLNAGALGEILVGRTACYSCPIACGRKVTVEKYSLKEVAGPEFQTIAAFGTSLKIPDIRDISLLNRLCNEYGMDTISCGGVIAFSAVLKEMGKLNEGPEWGDSERVVELVHQIAAREGLGRDLGEGVLRFAEAHDAREHALHVRGLEMPYHDPRAFGGLGTIYTIASRGACHMEGDMHTIDMGVDIRELGIVAGEPLENEQKGIMAAKAQEYRAFFDTTIMCHFAMIPVDAILGLLNQATGFAMSLNDILVVGARIVAVKRMLNLRLGLDTKDERLPAGLLTPQPEEVTDDFVPDVDAQLDEYYEYKGWDRDSGRPREETLNRLGLDLEVG